MYWACARLESRREALATHCLALAGFTVYLPRLRERRLVRGRRIEVSPPLFPGYAFVAIALQWHGARWCAGVRDLIMDGAAPARVPDGVIAEIRARERGGLVELPKSQLFRTGDRLRVIHGPFAGHVGPLCRDAATRARRGLAGDPRRLPAGHACRRGGRGGVLKIATGIATGRGGIGQFWAVWVQPLPCRKPNKIGPNATGGQGVGWPC